MNAPGGGADIGELLRQLGGEPLLRELESAGLSPKLNRCRCPFPGCCDKGADRERDAQVFLAGKPHIHCFACSTTGDLLDVMQITRSWSKDEAIAHLRGQPAPVRPPLQLVQPAAPVEDPDRLKPAEAKRIWEAMARTDADAERYLEGRGLGDAVGLGLARFALPAHPDKRVTGHAKRGYRLALLLTDVVGNARGVQMRLIREPKGRDEHKVMSVKGSDPGRGFFGTPELIESSPVVCVAEGMADTLAVAGWASGRKEVTVVGASGKGNIHKLAKELEAAGISVEGKAFLLFTQNDAPKNESRREFERLRQLLVARGARAVHCNTDKEYGDVAEYLQGHPDTEWPPAEALKAFRPDEDEGPAESSSPHAVAIPEQITADNFAQDFTTLCALLDDVGHREGIAGRRGELTFCEMTHRVRIGGRPVEEVDLSAMRLGIESHGRSTDGKPLKFAEEEIARALKLLARRKTVHPVREWLTSLKWDGHCRMDVEFPAAMGQAKGAFSGILLGRWLISVVARPMSPGCKSDDVLVLVGPQGAGKSTFFNAIGGDDWFTDSPVNVGDKDGKMLMREKWIVEWAELDAMKRARDKEAIRGFLSQKVDHFREPYGRGVITAPRGCVIVGTTNNREFLSDFERRFFPVEVNRVDLAWVRANREQLLAEAVARYRAGEQWHLTPEEGDYLAKVQEEHRTQHPWMELVDDWLRDKGLLVEVTVTQVLIEALSKPQHQLSQADKQAVAGVLQDLGWERRRRTSGGSLRWVYVRPEAA